MRVVPAVILTALATAAAGAAQQPQAPAPAPAPAKSEPTSPVSSVRMFTAPVGLVLNAVRPERVDDFEKLIGHLQSALAASSDPTIREQAKGWKVFKASETGPNGSVLYVFILDPTVKGADYGLGRILAEAFPDTARLQEIWKLYQDSVASGGSLLNLTPVDPKADSQQPARGGKK
jgi:hypothetical protein